MAERSEKGKMETPIFDFARKYQKSGTERLHMPGHKGVSYLGCESLDITEINGADSLYEADGIIAESERNASGLFGFGRTFYSTEGSSQCVKAMMYLAVQYGIQRGKTGRTVLAARNVHRSFIHAMALLDLEPKWIYPEDGAVNSVVSCRVEAQTVENLLDKKRDIPLAVYLTAPDYLGYSPDIAAIAKVCRARDIPLLVDNAHGAYLKFLPESKHPVDLGAFMSCDSAHKTLPVLTGGAYLQLSPDVPKRITDEAKNALALFGSTSPSYLILQSLDLCNKYISEGYREKLAEFLTYVSRTKHKLSSAGWHILPSDPLKIVVETKNMGYSGSQVAGHLRQNGIECEFADLYALVLMVTPDTGVSQLEHLAEVFASLPRLAPLSVAEHPITHNRRAMSVREALFSPHEIIQTAESAGRICASGTVSCPPAVPIAVSGEVISEECVKLMEDYGIKHIDVVAK
jgi:arginine/lysine/ornithine decarboxylase